MIDKNDKKMVENIIDTHSNDWIKDKSEILDSKMYDVYHGTGDKALVKLFINKEIVVDI